MSTTETQTSAPPQFTIFNRVACIPMISSSLSTLDDTLSSSYFRSPYSTAKGLSTSAYKYTEPLQIRFAPLIVRADGYANKAVDAVECRYPFPFKVKPDDVANYVREKQQSVASVANKTLDERVKSPAINVAQGIDQKFAPIVDYFEVAVTRFNNNSEPGTSTPPSPDTKYQYQRAYALSVCLRDELYVYSNEQIKQLQSQNVLVQRAMETAQSITALASSSITNAQTRIHSLSDKMLMELQKLQSSLPTQLPRDIQASFTDLSASLGATISELRKIVVSEASLGEKAAKLNDEVQHKVSPLLESLANMIGMAKGKGEEVAQNGGVNHDEAPQKGGAAKPKVEVVQNGGATKAKADGAQNGGSGPSGTRRMKTANGHAEK